jgi:hypothetical protein
MFFFTVLPSKKEKKMPKIVVSKSQQYGIRQNGIGNLVLIPIGYPICKA